jgi:LuxR family maltose regulon positive regulatory protein
MPGARKINTQRLYFTERLTQATCDIIEYPLTVVEAPMGYGKTTAVKEAVSRAGITPHWLHVFSDDTEGFWNNFCELIGELDGGCGESLRQLGFPNNAVSMNEALKLISCVKLSTSAVIVVDDYHHLDSAELNTFFELLSEVAVPSLHIVLTARHTKFDRLEELKLKKRLQYITNEAFELKPPEIAEYFKACGIPLSGEQSLKLYGMTEGWISALYLFLLEYVFEGGFTNAESIYRLLEKAVYAPMPGETKGLLLSVCIFDGFTLGQAEYIWGGSSAEHILSGLTDSNCFVAYDSRSKMYYIHSIFTNFLREAFEKRDIAVKTAVYRRAAGWYRQARGFTNARKYCFLSGDFDGLLTALEEDDTIDYSPYDKELLKTYMAACPEEVKARHPYALLKFAVPLFAHNEMTLAGQIYAGLSGFIRSNETLGEGERNRLEGMLELHLCFTSFNDINKMTLHQNNAWGLLKQPAEIFTRKIHWTFGSPSVLYLYYRESGRLKAHTDALIENLPLYSRLMNGHGAGGGYVMEAEHCFNAGDFDGTEISLQKAELEARAADESNILLCCEFLRARLDFLRGDHASLFGILKQMRETMADRKLYNYLHTVELCEGFVYGWLKQPDKLPRQLLEANPATLHIGFPAFGIFNMLLGRAMLLRGEYLKLLGSGDYFIRVASVFPNLLGIIYTNILLAAANHMTNRRADALDCLEKALDMALPDALYMPFSENCDYIEPLLRELSSDIAYREGIDKILGLYGIFRSGKERILSELNSDKSPLSDRELEIARLAAEGLSNREIGEQLYISENTVKSALKSVYAKLAVSDRLSLKDALTAIKK